MLPINISYVKKDFLCFVQIKDFIYKMVKI